MCFQIVSFLQRLFRLDFFVLIVSYGEVQHFVLSNVSMLWCPLRFPHKNDVRFAFISSRAHVIFTVFVFAVVSGLSRIAILGMKDSFYVSCFVDCCLCLCPFFFWPLCCLFFFDLRIPITLCLRIAVSSAYRVVFFALFVFVLCTQCCQFLWIVHSWLLLRFSLTFICFVCLRPVRQTKQINVRENRRSNQEWTIQRNWQRWVHKTAPSVFSNVSMFCLSSSCLLCTQCCQFLWIVHSWLLLRSEGAIKNGQFRETGNVGYIRHRTKTNKTNKR
jgi:hypothetical protein